jgi:nickel-type superoxide dismutase maturation protease
MGNRQLTFRVEGNSMNPLLRDGDEILLEPAGSYKVGDVVVATHPIQTDLTIVKRIIAIEDGRFRLMGDNPRESSDHFGLVDHSKIIGKFVSKLDSKVQSR